MRGVLLITWVMASCHQAPPASPLALDAATRAEASLAVLRDVCLKHSGDTRSVNAVARASAWRALPLDTFASWRDPGIPTKYRNIWSADTSDGAIIIALGILGGGNDVWVCRIAWDGISEPEILDGVGEIHVWGRTLGAPKLIQANVPNDGAENTFFASSNPASNEWVAINYSRPAAPGTAGKVRIEVTTLAR